MDAERAQQRLASIARSRRAAPSAGQAEREGTLVLVVDDHPTNRMLLMRQVRTLGYAAECAENGVVALARWQSSRFGLVITDCNMPEMDGYELAQAIRAIERDRGAARVPIIACTASALAGQRARCLAAKMDDCLVKPVDLAQMLRTLDQWLPLPDRVAGASPDSRALARAEPAASQPALDRVVLAESSGGDANVERTILAAFRQANDSDAIALDRAVLEQNLAAVTRTAHGMSGASRVIGALGLASVCARIEHAGRAGDWTAIATDMQLLNTERMRLDTCVDTIWAPARAVGT